MSSETLGSISAPDQLGSGPVIVPLAGDGGARVEVATAADSRERALGPVVAPAPPPSEEVRAPTGSRRTGMIHACARLVLVWVLTPFSVTSA